MSKPTPRPWDAERFEHDILNVNGEADSAPNDFVSIKAGTEYIADIFGLNQEANAAHIVKCVNMYEEMLELLMEASNCLTHEVGRSDIIVRIDELIAKAKAGGGE